MAYRAIVLEAKRLPGPVTLEEKAVDAVEGLTEALELVARLKLVEKGRTGVYGLLRREMYRETMGYLESHEEQEEKFRRIDEEEWQLVIASKNGTTRFRAKL